MACLFTYIQQCLKQYVRQTVDELRRWWSNNKPTDNFACTNIFFLNGRSRRVFERCFYNLH